MAITKRSAIFLSKTETVYGTDSAPTPAANAVLGMDIVYKAMEGQDVERTFDLGFFGNTGSIPADLYQEVSFKVELWPSGTAGTAPAWGPLLMACGCAQTIVPGVSVTYNPITEQPSSATKYFIIGNTRYVMLGSRGSAKFGWTKQGIPTIDFSFKGLFTLPTEIVRPANPTYTAYKTPSIAAKRHVPLFSLNGVTGLKCSALSLDLGKKVEPRLLMNSEEILITDARDKIGLTIEAEALSVLNPFQLALDATPIALQFQHGNVAGKRLTLNIPAMQLERPSSLEDSQGVVEWAMSGMPLPTTSNDQFTLVLT